MATFNEYSYGTCGDLSIMYVDPKGGVYVPDWQVACKT